MFDNCLSHCCKVLVSAVNSSRCAAHLFIAPWELRHSNHVQLHPVNLQCLEAYVPNIQSPELHQCTCICNYKMYGLIPALSLMSRLLSLPNHHRRQCSIISNLKESIKLLNLGISSLTWTWGVCMCKVSIKHCIPFCTSTETCQFPLQLALQYVFTIPFCIPHKMLVFPVSLRDILQWAHKIGACLHPLLVPYPNHPEMHFCLKDLIMMIYIFYASKLLETSRKNALRQQTMVFWRAHTQKKLL